MNLAGRILIAMPGLSDERFSHAVILICAHSEDGAMGLIINRPADHVTMRDLLEQLSIPGGSMAHGIVHAGGPVEMERGFVLHTTEYQASIATVKVSSEFAMTATLDVLEDIANYRGPEQAMVALGYCGWAPGQLESELAENGWLIGEPTRQLVFGAHDGRKWEQAMSALGIDPISLSARAGRA